MIIYNTDSRDRSKQSICKSINMRTGLEMIEVILTINNLDIDVLVQETVCTVALKSINRMISTMVTSQKSSVPNTQTNILVFLLPLSMRKSLTSLAHPIILISI